MFIVQKLTGQIFYLGCALSAKGADEETEANLIDNMDTKKIEEMLRSLTLQERIAFDNEQQTKLQSEVLKLRGELDYVVQREVVFSDLFLGAVQVNSLLRAERRTGIRR